MLCEIAPRIVGAYNCVIRPNERLLCFCCTIIHPVKMRLALLVFEFLLGPLRSSVLEEAYPRIADSITNSTTSSGTEDSLSPGTSTASPNCTLYNVQINDNCFTITSATNTTWEQLLAWNPNLNVTCS